jgi:hypothetical protein
VPLLFPAARLQEEWFYDGALVHNNPTVLAIEEAKHFWGSNGTRNLVLSVGCGTTRERLNARNGPISCCTNSFLESMSAAKQNSDLLLCGYHFTRLDPCLDVDLVSLDDFEAMPKLQQSFAAMLSHDVAFVELLKGTAFELLSWFFYFEVLSLPVLQCKKSMEYSVTGMIRPRKPPSKLRHLYRHEVFQSLYFTVNGRPFSFSMPKKVSVLVKDLDSAIQVCLCSRSHQAQISGSPMSANELFAAQERFYRRPGSRKRSITRDSSFTRIPFTKCARTC